MTAMSASTVTTASIRRVPQVVAGSAGIVPSLLKDTPKGRQGDSRPPRRHVKIVESVSPPQGLQWPNPAGLTRESCGNRSYGDLPRARERRRQGQGRDLRDRPGPRGTQSGQRSQVRRRRRPAGQPLSCRDLSRGRALLRQGSAKPERNLRQGG